MISIEARLARWAPLAAAAAVAVAYAIVALDLDAPAAATPLAPGAPAGWSILAAVAELVPLGSSTARVAMVSVVAAAVAAGLLVRLVIDSGREPVADAVGGVAGAALLATTAAWALPAVRAGAAAVTGALVLGCVIALDRVAQGGAAGAGVAAAALVGALAAVAPVSRVLLLPLGVLVAVRLRHGARWPLLVPVVTALTWALTAAHEVVRTAALAATPTAASSTAPARDGGLARYATDVFDQLGPFGAVAAAIGAVVLLGRGRRSRYLALTLGTLVAAAIVDDLGRPAGVGPLLAVVAAVTAAVAVARLLQMIRWPVGRVCVGLLAAVLLAVPAGSAPPRRWPPRGDGPRSIAYGPPAMEVIRGHAAAPASACGAVLAIGNFDGVHRGHLELIRVARARAAALGAQARALTFDPHPAAVLAPASAPRLLTPMPRRLELLADAGLDLVVVEPFDRALAAQRGVLRRRHPGRRPGLARRGGRLGLQLRQGPRRRRRLAHRRRRRRRLRRRRGAGLRGRRRAVSSSRIRARLGEGDVVGAAALLGRRWDVDGVVVHGAKRGRELGVPTANVATAGALPLTTGIYAVWLVDGDVRRAAVASLGTNPTFVAGGPVVLEVQCSTGPAISTIARCGSSSSRACAARSATTASTRCSRRSAST
ncbi:MAG: riboflavin kinase [Kofleriaceae bacterium]